MPHSDESDNLGDMSMSQILAKNKARLAADAQMEHDLHKEQGVHQKGQPMHAAAAGAGPANAFMVGSKADAWQKAAARGSAWLAAAGASSGLRGGVQAKVWAKTAASGRGGVKRRGAVATLSASARDGSGGQEGEQGSAVGGSGDASGCADTDVARGADTDVVRPSLVAAGNDGSEDAPGGDGADEEKPTKARKARVTRKTARMPGITPAPLTSHQEKLPLDAESSTPTTTSGTKKRAASTKEIVAAGGKKALTSTTSSKAKGTGGRKTKSVATSLTTSLADPPGPQQLSLQMQVTRPQVTLPQGML